MSNQVVSKSAEASNIIQLDVFSNKNSSESVSVAGGTVNLMYYESILQDSIRASVTFADTGNSVNNRNRHGAHQNFDHWHEGLELVPYLLF